MQCSWSLQGEIGFVYITGPLYHILHNRVLFCNKKLSTALKHVQIFVSTLSIANGSHSARAWNFVNFSTSVLKLIQIPASCQVKLIANMNLTAMCLEFVRWILICLLFLLTGSLYHILHNRVMFWIKKLSTTLKHVQIFASAIPIAVGSHSARVWNFAYFSTSVLKLILIPASCQVKLIANMKVVSCFHIFEHCRAL